MLLAQAVPGLGKVMGPQRVETEVLQYLPPIFLGVHGGKDLLDQGRIVDHSSLPLALAGHKGKRRQLELQGKDGFLGTRLIFRIVNRKDP